MSVFFSSKAQINVYIYQNNKKIKHWQISDTSLLDLKLKKFLQDKRDNGFLYASIDSILSDSNNIKIYFFKGEKFFWNQISCKIDSSKAYKIDKFKHKIANISKLQKEMQNICKKFTNSGYPFAKAKIIFLEIKKNTINAQIQINKGRYVYFDSIYFDKKNLNISEKFLENFLDFKPHKAFNYEIVRNINKKMQNLDFIEIVSPAELEFHKKNVDLYLYPKKIKSNQISGIVSFTNVNNKFSIIGEASVNLVNIFKSADKINLTWKHTKTLSQNFNTNFLLPYLFGTKFGLYENLNIEKFDTSYVNFSNQLRINYFIAGLNKLGASFNFYRSIIIDSSENLANYKSKTYGIFINFQNFDYPLNPRKAYKFTIQTEVGNKITNDSSEYLLTAKSNIIIVRPLSTHSIIFFQNSTQIIQSPFLYENELIKFGGAKLMRGFDEESLSASFLSITSLELRYLFAKNSNIFLFSDYGIFQHYSISEKYWQHPFSIGLGTHLATKRGILSLSLAIGKLDSQNFEFSQTKVHFGFKTLF
jgi:hypothetical protein